VTDAKDPGTDRPTDGDREITRARAYYDAFAPTYERRRDGRGRYHDLIDDLEVELVAPYVRGRDVLEVGCGTGLILRRLAEGARRAVGVDLSPRMLECARARDLEVVEGSATALPFADASFDVVVSFKTLPHVPDLSRALTEMARVLRPSPDAVLVAELYNPSSLRAVAKRVLPASRIGEGNERSGRTERDVLVRYDDRRALERALPRGFVIDRARGIRTVTLAARVLDVPLVGGAIVGLERALADTPIATRFGGFVCWVLRRG
jgi:SAM-dependent methyltransferase